VIGMLWRYIGRPICGLIAHYPEAFVCVGTSAVMIGLAMVYQLYGMEAFIAVAAVIIVLGLSVGRHHGVPFPDDISGPPEPIALPGNRPPGLSGPSAQARIGGTGAKVIPSSLSSTFQGVSGPEGSGGHPVLSGRLSRPD
jgi:hypothetical protein